MNLDLTGKVALVTGSSRGIGLAIAKTLASEGCRIILNARNIEQLENTAKSLNLEHVPGDVCTWAGAKRVVEQATEKAGHLDILVTNVGSGMSVPPGMEDETEWFRMLNLNLMSATNTISAARPTLARQRGVVLCVSSICGIATVGAPLAYSAAKAALNSYVRGVSPPWPLKECVSMPLPLGTSCFPARHGSASYVNRQKRYKRCSMPMCPCADLEL